MCPVKTHRGIIVQVVQALSLTHTHTQTQKAFQLLSIVWTAEKCFPYGVHTDMLGRLTEWMKIHSILTPLTIPKTGPDFSSAQNKCLYSRLLIDFKMNGLW